MAGGRLRRPEADGLPAVIWRAVQEFPDSSRSRPIQRILAFGKEGTYKWLAPMIEAFDLVSAKLPDAKLVIAGGDRRAHFTVTVTVVDSATEPEVPLMVTV